ncbi:hypothetical protein DSECCO2_521890 [anaerobic digester metagenome]
MAHRRLNIHDILIQTSVPAGLQQIGTHRNRPQSASQQINDIECIGSGRKRDVEQSVKFGLQLGRKVNRYRMKCAAAHVIHLFIFRKNPADVHAFQCIGQLQSKENTCCFSSVFQISDNR